MKSTKSSKSLKIHLDEAKLLRLGGTSADSNERMIGTKWMTVSDD